MNVSTFYSEVSKFERLGTQKCINTYAADYLSEREFILVTNNMNADDASLRWVGMGNSPQKYLSNSFSSICESEPSYPNVTYKIDDLTNCTRYPCLKHYLGEQCKAECLCDCTALSIPWSAPLLNMDLSSDTPYVSYNVSGDGVMPDHTTFGDKSEDLSSLIHFLRGYPQASELQQCLKNVIRWKNSSWAEDIRIQNTGIAHALETVNSSFPALSVDHCLSQEVDERCQLLFSLSICLTIIICNIIKIACMLMTVYDDRKEIFLTVGDAISSFLKRPDRTTEHRSLLPKRNISERSPQCWERPDKERSPPQLATFRSTKRR